MLFEISLQINMCQLSSILPFQITQVFKFSQFRFSRADYSDVRIDGGTHHQKHAFSNKIAIII